MQPTSHENGVENNQLGLAAEDDVCISLAYGITGSLGTATDLAGSWRIYWLTQESSTLTDKTMDQKMKVAMYLILPM